MPADPRHGFVPNLPKRSSKSPRRDWQTTQGLVMGSILRRLQGTQFPEPPPAECLAVQSAVLPITVSVPFIVSPVTVPV
jgi:hypothetical protein